MVMRPVWISVYGCLAPAFLRFGGGGYYHYPVLGTELAAVLKARGEGRPAFLSVARNFAFSSTARYHAPHGRAGNDPSISSPVSPMVPRPRKRLPPSDN